MSTDQTKMQNFIRPTFFLLFRAVFHYYQKKSQKIDTRTINSHEPKERKKKIKRNGSKPVIGKIAN